MNAEPTSGQRSPIPRIDALTGLRILPALAVMLSHLERPPWAGPHFKAFLAAGYSGVTIFFVLSGFVLAHNYFDRFAQGFTFGLTRSYLAARIARVYPLYLLMLVWVSFPALWAGETRGSLWFEHAFALQAWSGKLSDAFAYNAPGWSISVEFFLYACFPLLVLLFLPVRTLRGTLLALFVVVAVMSGLTAYFVASGYGDLPRADPHSSHRWLYRNPACRLGDFMLGMLSARLLSLRVSSRTAPAVRGWSWGAAAAALVIVVLMCWPANIKTSASWDVLYAVPAAALILCLAAAPTCAGARLLSTKPVLLLGEASYALYLCHDYMLRRVSLSGLPPDAWLVGNGLTILMILAIAVGLHVMIERPSRVLLRWMFDPAARERSAPVAKLAIAD